MGSIKSIKKISNKKIRSGESFLFSAGFNVDKSLNNTERVDEEIKDLKRLIKHKAKVFVLSHQGRFKKKDTIHFDFLVPYLRRKLKCKVIYFRKDIAKNITKIKNLIKPGEVLLLPNSRFYHGEENNNVRLGKLFASIADNIIIGGFSKIHRSNSSNNSILKFKPGYLSSGIVKEIKELEKWKNINKKNSICILGGVKKEKISIGFKYMPSIYSNIVPGGIVLNTILYALGYNVGKSLKGDKKDIATIKKVLKKHRKKIFIPKNLIVSNYKNFNFNRVTNVEEIKKNEVIVGYEFSNDLFSIFKKTLLKNGKILLAGTPSLFKKNFKEPSIDIIKFMEKNKKRSLLLGGDSASELKFSGKTSSGGGAALLCLTNNNLPSFKLFNLNKRKFREF